MISMRYLFKEKELKNNIDLCIISLRSLRRVGILLKQLLTRATAAEGIDIYY